MDESDGDPTSGWWIGAALLLVVLFAGIAIGWWLRG